MLALVLIVGLAALTGAALADGMVSALVRGGAGVAFAREPSPAAPRPWPENHFAVLCYHDIGVLGSDRRYFSLSLENLKAHFQWLQDHGYTPVSVDRILEAAAGGPALPERAVLLTFDDGYRSFHQSVFPLLKARGWPAVYAPVGLWIDTPDGETVDFGGVPTDRSVFGTWDEIAEMAASGLVEIASHSWNLHRGVVANPRGNALPAAAYRIYDPATGTYEDDAAFRARVRADVDRMTRRIEAVTGRAPRVWVWPYGEASGETLGILAENHYRLALTLDRGLASTGRLLDVPRYFVGNGDDSAALERALASIGEPPVMRVVHVDLDYVHDPDPVQEERNLDLLVQRIRDLGPTTVFLQAFADPGADGNIREVYFPNSVLPVRRDLFSRVSWQLRSRARVDVYAWMPVLALEMDPALPRVLAFHRDAPGVDVGSHPYRRLSPYSAAVRARVLSLYGDLARHAPFQGILYHDDLVLSDFEDVGPDALAAYTTAGLPGTLEGIRAMDGAAFRQWTRFKTRTLSAFTRELTDRVRAIRGPGIRTARNIFANPVLNPDSEAWFAQNLDEFLETYDWTAPMAMPLMEQVPEAEILPWLDRMVDTVARRPGGLERTVFELQSRDWRSDPSMPVDSAVLAGWMARLEARGARSFGYYPDDFYTNSPDINGIGAYFSRGGEHAR
ncbi:poly-beta-1,6-N-acetyl-D-glucosamine N-deacetylase PgaB [Phaeovibrio sulfidiphilus]|uniref:poly-beta-1,6-N-acetyl-D-glucosamine N-deacetylase PgaB n=1 Tax=Phaeovibrio sulfidiphilus TaxID=1220600 RepID=UPI0018D7A9A1